MLGRFLDTFWIDPFLVKNDLKIADLELRNGAYSADMVHTLVENSVRCVSLQRTINATGCHRVIHRKIFEYLRVDMWSCTIPGSTAGSQRGSTAGSQVYRLRLQRAFGACLRRASVVHH